MTRTADVVIVGAGVMGASVAWHLTMLGCRSVILLDSSPTAGTGSTGRATGGFRAQFASPINVQLSLLSREKLRQFTDTTGGDCGYQPVGYLFLAADQGQLATLRAAGDEWWTGWEHVSQALAQVRLPGRFNRVGRFIFDVAHNADGARVLAATLSGLDAPPPVVAILCVLSDKDWRAMMEALSGVVSEFILTDAPTAPASRAWSLTEARAYATSRGWNATAVHDFDAALRLGEESGGTVLVTGSFHTVGDAMARLQVDPLAG